MVSGRLDRTRLLAARLRAAQDRPYLATALFSLTVVESEDIATMGVDRHWRCYVSPDFVAATPVPELAGTWIHEVAHLLRDHHGRAAHLREHPLRLNVAQDLEINDDLIADGLPLPAGIQLPHLYGLPDGLVFESYLPRLPPAPPEVDCGSGAHGSSRPWELGPAGGVGAVEAEAIRRDAARQIRSAGTVPAGWRRWAAQVLEPKVDWRQQLRGSVREAVAWAGGAVDYTYRRPSRRSAAVPGVVLPSLRRPVPRVAVVVDTSGSMSEALLTAALTEVGGVLRAVGIGGNRVTVLSCDADVHAVRAVADVGEVELIGGGGTDMRVGIEEALRGRPQIVIVLTDGYTPWPGQPLETTKVIAGLLGSRAPRPPAWIDTLVIDEIRS